VIALVVCLAGVAISRYLRATAPRPAQPASVTERAGVAAYGFGKVLESEDTRS
jgi:hypothetical protein